jgi:pimeloyl-ACP methyl ester carboxylesterase/chaperonin cofactor prefoldin
MRIWISILTTAALLAQVQQPQARYYPTEQEKRQIYAKLAELSAATGKLEKSPLYADVAIYQKAGEFIISHPEEFVKPSFIKDTVDVLDKGIARAKEVDAGSPSWTQRKGRLVRAYRSTIDGSIQPYGLIVPDSYTGQPIRLDVWMHGTNRALNEIAFLTQHETSEPVPDTQNYIQLDVYGRSNVSYRWAGETDVFEAIRSVQTQYKIDPKRIALRGFSMGGAGAWHLGLHHPGEWAVFEAGAGYTETKVYAKKPSLPAYQEAALHYYDAQDYALNGTNVPFVGYGGEIDAQLQASKNVKAELIKEGIDLAGLRALFLVGPNTAHKWEPEAHKISEHFIEETLAEGLSPPPRIRFVTYTTRFNRCFWITVEELEKSYTRAEVDAAREANRTTVTTTNVDRIRVDGSGPVSLDGQEFPATGVFAKASGKWAKAGPRKGLHKLHALQGPVDDAFMDSFLCVRPTGAGTSVTGYALVVLDQFEKDFSKWLRGDPRVKDDRDVTASDIANNNLILFGDPWSNQLIAKVIAKLPIKWTKEEITLASHTVDATKNAPVLIFPNPLNPARYVVINSGHTFSEDDWRGTNASLFPHIGDYALIAISNQEVVNSGFFDDHWR